MNEERLQVESHFKEQNKNKKQKQKEPKNHKNKTKRVPKM